MNWDNSDGITFLSACLLKWAEAKSLSHESVHMCGSVSLSIQFNAFFLIAFSLSDPVS